MNLRGALGKGGLPLSDLTKTQKVPKGLKLSRMKGLKLSRMAKGKT